ncbi:MAG TPA: hypothetical protein VND54_06165 [Candidatus Saccharimonadales bacterium]|nr:hypothetical protein [Candidatus Saccharimonadales bacterium]
MTGERLNLDVGSLDAGLASFTPTDLDVRRARTRAVNAVATIDDSSASCPYSEETVVGCRFYRPVSAHGDFPEAGHCADASVLTSADHIRHTICRRRMRVAAGRLLDHPTLSPAGPRLG